MNALLLKVMSGLAVVSNEKGFGSETICSNVTKILQLKIFLDRTMLPVLPYNHCSQKMLLSKKLIRDKKYLILIMRKEDYDV